MNTPLSSFLAMTLTLFLTACGSKDDSKAMDPGHLEGSRYFNSYFNLSIQVPDTWFIQNERMLKQIAETGSKTFKANDDMTDRAVKEALEKRTHNLFAAFQHEVGTPVEFNPNLVLVAEDISVAPGVKTGKDYHFHVKHLLQNSNMQVSFPEDNQTVELGPYSFDAMPMNLLVNGVTVRQVYYATVKGNYVLSIIISYGTDDQYQELQTILGTIKATP